MSHVEPAAAQEETPQQIIDRIEASLHGLARAIDDLEAVAIAPSILEKLDLNQIRRIEQLSNHASEATSRIKTALGAGN